jgi:DNA-nicking Smr family endonuclease
MSLDDTKKRRRKLSADEHALWGRATQTVAPLQRLRNSRTDPDVAERARKAAPPSRPETATQPAGVAPKPGPTTRATPKPAPVPLDRRVKQRLARGTEPIAARLDLHGRTQSEAQAALLRFLRRAQADGARFVLVITGKGARTRDDGNERGVLQRQVPLWLELPEFRAYVVGFEHAHIGHGGEGALYVRLRRAK